MCVGRDCGGVSREFFELLSVECFNTANGLFRKFSDSTQALVCCRGYHFKFDEASPL